MEIKEISLKRFEERYLGRNEEEKKSAERERERERERDDKSLIDRRGKVNLEIIQLGDNYALELLESVIQLGDHSAGE